MKNAKTASIVAAAAATAVFNAAWLMVGLPLLAAVASPIVAVVQGTGAIGQIAPSVSDYVQHRLLTGFLTCDYLSLPAIPGWLVLAAADAAFLASAMRARKPTNAVLDAQPKATGSNEYENARLLRTDAEIRAEDDIIVTRQRDIETKARGVYLGMNERGDVYTYDADEHCMLLAPTRSGKTRRELVEIITMLTYAGEYMTIFDPKGELFGYCSDFQRARGYVINRIDFDHPDRGNLYNPLIRAVDCYRRINCMPRLDLPTLAMLDELRDAARRARDAVREGDVESRRAYYEAAAAASCAEAGRACTPEQASEIAELRFALDAARAAKKKAKADGPSTRAHLEAVVRYRAAIYGYELADGDMAVEIACVRGEEWRPASLFEQVDRAKRAVAETSGDERDRALAYLFRKKEALDELIKTCESEVDRLVETIHPREREKENGTAAFYADGADNVMKMSFHAVLSARTCPDECKTPATVARVMRTYLKPNAIDPKNRSDDRAAVALYQIIGELDTTHPAYKYMGILGSSSKYIGEFVNEAQGIMERFSGVAINQMMRGTDYHMEDLVLSDRPTATYIIVPQDATESLRQMALLYIDQMYAVLQELARDRGGRLPKRMNMLCEELGQLPPIKNLAQRLALSGGTGFRWILVLQDFAQIDDNYGRDARPTIVNNTRYNVLVEVGDPLTARYYSEMAGTYTIEKEGSTTSKAPLGLMSDRVGENTSLMQRKRMSEAEILQWKSEYGSLLWRRGHPLTVMPTPDLASTPFNEALGCGNEEHNTAKALKALSAKVHSEGVYIEEWGPEIDNIEKLAKLARHNVEDTERKDMRAKHLTGLIAGARKKAEEEEKAEMQLRMKAEGIERLKEEGRARKNAGVQDGARTQAHRKPAGKEPPAGKGDGTPGGI